MAGVGGIFIYYRDGFGEAHQFTRYFQTDSDAATWLADDGANIVLTGASPVGHIDNSGTAIRAWLKAYQEVASTGSSIISLRADFRTTGGPGTVDSSATYTCEDFVPAGGTAGYGAFPTSFVAIKAKSSESKRPAWIRFYTTGLIPTGQPMTFNTTDISSDFAAWLGDFTHFSGHIIGMSLWSGSKSIPGHWVFYTQFATSVARLGAANG